MMQTYVCHSRHRRRRRCRLLLNVMYGPSNSLLSLKPHIFLFSSILFMSSLSVVVARKIASEFDKRTFISVPCRRKTRLANEANMFTLYMSIVRFYQSHTQQTKRETHKNVSMFLRK